MVSGCDTAEQAKKSVREGEVGPSSSPDCYECSVSFSSARVGASSQGHDWTREPWLIDSCANIVVTDERDPCVKSVTSKFATLGTTSGAVQCKYASIETPVGIRRGLVRRGAPRLIPGSEFRELATLETVTTASGQKFNVQYKDECPALAFAARIRGRRNRGRKKKPPKTPLHEDSDCDSDVGAGSRDPATTPERTPLETPESDAPSPLEPREVTFMSNVQKRAQKQEPTKVGNPFTHLKCGCQLCQEAKQKFTARRKGRRKKRPLTPGEVVVADLCTDWPGSEEGSICLVLRDMASGIMYTAAMRQKLPAEVAKSLADFVQILAEIREGEGIKTPKAWVWTFHTDQGGEFTGDAVADLVTKLGGVQKFCPTDIKFCSHPTNFSLPT